MISKDETIVALQSENTALRQRVAELEEQLSTLASSEARYRMIFEGSGDALFLMNTDAFLECNQAALDILDCADKSHIVGHYPSKFSPECQPDGRLSQEKAKYFITRAQNGETIRFEWMHRRCDGQDIPIEVVLSPVVLNGEPLLIGSWRDITERKHIEEELLTFKAVAENTSDGLALVSPEGIITYANPSLKAMMGYGDDLVGSPLGVSFGGNTEEAEQIIRHVIEHGIWQGPMYHCRKDGSAFQIHLSMFAIRNASGQPVMFPGFVRDMTEFNQIEAERAALQQQIIDSQQATIQELSTPLLPMAEDVLVLPLVGTLDSSRAVMVMETLLDGIAAHQASQVIVDITGIKVVDTQVAQALIRTAQAVKLLGAQIILTGIQPQIAQTLIHLGADLSGIATRSTLQSGIAFALHNQDRHNGSGAEARTV